MSIRTKITVPAIIVAVVSILAILVVVSLAFSTFVDESVYTQVDIYADILQSQLEMYKDEARIAAMAIAGNDDIQRAVASRDRAALLERWDRLRDEIGTEFVTFTDASGTVIARSHAPEAYGDDLSGLQNIRAALDGEPRTYTEQGPEINLATRGGYPVYDDNGALVGVVSTGYRLDNEGFVDKMSELTECEVTVFLGDTRISTTVQDESGTRAVGTTADQAISAQVLGGQRYSGEANILGNEIYAVYLPIDDGGGNIVGMLFAGRYTGTKQATILSFALRGLLVGAILLAIAVPCMIVIGRRITAPINDMVQAAQSLAVGNVDVVVETTAKDEMKDLANAFNSMIASTRQQASAIERIAGGNLSGVVAVRSSQDVVGKALGEMLDQNNEVFRRINEVARQVSYASDNVADSAQSLSQANIEQASSIDTLNQTISEISARTGENARRAGEAAQLTEDIRGKAENGSGQMARMLHAVRDINEASTKIESVIKIIDDIAFQTNILALNAAVEAARAGAHGKGFAVVAEEVRNLAVKSAEAARGSGEMIHNTMDKAALGSEIATETAQTLAEIVGGVSQSSSLIAEISQTTVQQAEAISQVTDSVASYSATVQETSALSEQTAAASEEMSSQATVLTELVGRFRLRDQPPPLSSGEPVEEYGMSL